ncbi:MAG: indolepyruvate oxidoreductase subunit beta [Thermodesulfobacteriota bacterium]
MATKRIIFVGVGGQGNLLASRILGEAALASSLAVQVNEIHGMAQRGGVVESAVVMGQARGPIVSPGEADAIVGFEPLETLRALGKANADTTVITSTSKLPPFTVAIGQGEYPELDLILKLISERVKRLVAFEAMELARQARNPLGVNMVLLGALSASLELPLQPGALRRAVADGSKKAWVEANLKCFDLGAEAAHRNPES